MSKPNPQATPKTKNDKFWQFRNLADDDQKAELLLYGDISERSWWEDAATPKRFADDLAALGDVKEITVYINSGGGDVFAAQAIGNMLERNSATVTAHIDGLCASAATIVACHADKVVAAADGSYMIHPVSMGICDYLTADDLNNCLKALEAIRSNIITLYAKKSGKTEEECAKWMDETSWWTPAEAKEKGFVDEVDDDAEDSVVENRNGILFVNSICCYDRGTDRQGYEETVNIIEAIMQHFKRKPVFGEAFKVGYPRKWELSDDDMDYYYWGIVNLICETPNTLKNEEVEALI